MQISICDDDELTITKLKSYICDFFSRNHIKLPPVNSYSSGNALLADSKSKDIVFLDIEMPGMNGIYVGNELKKSNPNVIIIIVTSFSEYLDEAMRFHVFRYLSKPIDKQRLFRNLRDALKHYNTTVFKLPIETKEGVFTVLLNEIVFVEATGRQVVVHTIQRDYTSIYNLQYWRDLLPETSFFQSHRSFLVNLNYVSDFDHTLIHLANNQFSAYLTRRKYTAFKEAYFLFLESMR